MRNLVLELILAAVTVPITAQSAHAINQPDLYDMYSQILARPNLYPNDFDTLDVTNFYSSTDDLCRLVTASCPRDLAYTAGQVYWYRNQRLAMAHHFLDGARTEAFGPGWNRQGCNPGIPDIWVGVGHFLTAADAEKVSAELLNPDILGTAPSPQRIADIGDGGALLQTAPGVNTGGAEVQQLTFFRGSFAVLIYMVRPDGGSVLRIGRATDQSLIEATATITKPRQSPIHASVYYFRPNSLGTLLRSTSYLYPMQTYRLMQ
jgi:hypothetical protein